MVGSPDQNLSETGTLEVPRHIAIIMDGNGRWAAKRFLPRKLGHRQGVETVREIVRAAGEIGLKYLTLYSFSSENWKRPADEVSELMGLLKHFIRGDLAELHQNNVAIRIIGEREHLSPDIVALLEEAEALTRGNTGLVLQIAFNYGGQNEIVGAMKRIGKLLLKGEITPDAITPELIAKHLDTAGVPDPDLVIRTSGEKRISNFLIWQSAYAEFVFTDVLWPDFTRKTLEAAIAEFKQRDRRFGARDSESP